MAEKVAEAFISFVMEKLFEKLSSAKFLILFWGKKSIDDQLKELNMKLKKANLLLNDAEDKQLEEPNVKKWLDELKGVIYRAQDLVDEIEYEFESNTSLRKKRKFSNYIIPSFSEFDRTVQGELYKLKTLFNRLFLLVNWKAKPFLSSTKFYKTAPGEIAKIMEDLNHLLDDEVTRGLKVEGAHKNITIGEATSQTPLAPWLEGGRVRGRDADEKKIMDFLLCNEVWGGKIGVLPVVINTQTKQ